MKTNEVKKSQKANLESQKGMYWLMGVVVAAAFVFLALEWTSETSQGEEIFRYVADMPEGLPPVPRPPEPPPPPPPPPEMPPDIPTDLKVVEDPVNPIDFPDEDRVVPIQQPPTPPPSVAPPPDILDIIDFPDVRPEFPGGMQALMQWLQRNMNYPTAAAESGLQGRVTLQFIVERDGSISNVEVVQSSDPIFNREALRVVNAMPRWNPGIQDNQPIRGRFTLPIHFRLST